MNFTLTSCCLSHSTQNPVSQHSLWEQNSRRARPEIMQSFHGGFLGLVSFRFLFYIPENLRVQMLVKRLSDTEVGWNTSLLHKCGLNIWEGEEHPWRHVVANFTGFPIDRLPPCYWWKVAGKKRRLYLMRQYTWKDCFYPSLFLLIFVNLSAFRLQTACGSEGLSPSWKVRSILSIWWFYYGQAAKESGEGRTYFCVWSCHLKHSVCDI